MKRIFTVLFFISATLILSGCASTSVKQQDGPPKYRVNAHKIPNAVPKYLPKSKYGNPDSYVVMGKRYHVMKTAIGYNKRGIASWYGTKFQGRLTSSREPYNLAGMTAASPVLPIPTYVRVTNLNNNKSVIVKVNDRGPFAPNRIIDLSYAAATKLGYVKQGTALVQVTAIDTRNPSVAPPTPVLAHQPRLYLQLGAFDDFANAQRLQGRIQELTQRKVRIAKGNASGHAIYRVQIGPLIGVGESDELQMNLAKEGFGKAFTVIS